MVTPPRRAVSRHWADLQRRGLLIAQQLRFGGGQLRVQPFAEAGNGRKCRKLFQRAEVAAEQLDNALDQEVPEADARQARLSK